MRNLTSTAAALALALSTIAAAQTYSVRTYPLEQLALAPGLVELSPNYLTLLEFPDTVQSVATGRSDLIDVTVDGRRIILRPTRTTGKTDLLVQVSGETAMFTIEIIEGNGMPRRYVLAPPEQPDPIVRGTTPNDEPSPTTDDEPSPTTDDEPSPTTNGELDPAPTPHDEPHTDGTPVDMRGASTTVAGERVPFEFTTEVDIRNDHELVFRYRLTNNGDTPIANDGTRLRILDENDRSIPHALIRMNPDGTLNRIGANKTEYGTVRIPNPPTGEFRIEWPLVEIGPGNTYVIDEILTRLE